MLYVLSDDESPDNAIKFFANVSKGAKEAATSVGSSAGRIKTAVVGIGGGLKAAWSSLGTFGKIGLVVAGVTVLYGIIQKIQNIGAEANKKMDESVSKYEETKSELASVNSELSETERAIDSLQSKGGLSFVEKDDLERLQAQTRELKLQQDLLEKQAAADAKKAAGDAVNAVKKNYGTNMPTSEDVIQEQRNFNAPGGYVTNPGRNISAQLLNWQILKKRQEELAPDDIMWRDYERTIKQTEDVIWGAVADWQNYKSTIESLPEEVLSSEDKNMLNILNSSIDTVYRLLDNNMWKQMKLDDIYTDASLKSAKDRLVDMASGMKNVGITVDDVTARFPQLAAAAEQAGLEVQDIVDSINSEAGVVTGSNGLEDIVDRSQYTRFLQENNIAQSQFQKAFADGFGDDQTSQAIKGMLQEYADYYGIAFDQLTTDQVQAAAKYFADMGILVKDVADEAAATFSETLKESSSSTMSVISGIQNAQKVLGSQEAGKSISMDDFNSEDIKDYASALEYVNGVYQLNTEKVNDLIKAKVQEQIDTNKANKAHEQSRYLENALQIQKYRKELEKAEAAGNESTDTIKNSINALLAENASIKADCASYDLMISSLEEATSAYQNWINAQSAGESGDMFDSALKALQQIDDTLNNSDSDLFGRIGREDYKAAVDFVIPDTIDKEDSDAVNSYIESISDMFTYDKSGNKNGLNIWNFLDKSIEQGLLVEDGDKYRIAGEKTMQDFADGLGLALPLVRAMFGELEEFGAVFDWSDEAKKTFGDMAVAAADAAETLEAKLGKDYQLSIDVSDVDKNLDTVDKQLSYLDKTIEDMQTAISKKETIGLDDSEVIAAQDIIRAAVAQKQLLTEPAIMSVDASKVSSEVAPALELLQQFQNAQNNLEMDASVGADTSQAESEIKGLVEQIQGLDPEILAKIGLEPTGADAIQDYINGLKAPEISVKFGADTSLVDSFEKRNHSARGTVKWYNDESNLKKSFSRTGYVYWQNVGGGGSGKVNGSANVSGSAKLSGDWSAQGGTSLVGELGREIIVNPNTGRWYTVGDNGAEFVNIPDGAIIFNHKQSASLLENGRVAGRGTSYASGSAFVTGYIPSSIRKYGSSASGKNPGYSAPSGGTGSSVENNYDNELEKFDWIEVAIDRIERVIERLGKVADSVFKSLKSKLSASVDEISMVTQEIDLQQRAYDKYMSAAESVSLSSDLKELVRNGAIDISQYNKDTTELINDYKDLYEKALDCSSAIDDLHESLAQLYKDRFDAFQENYNNQLSLLQKQSDALSQKIDMLEEQGYMQSANYYIKLQDIERQNIQTLSKELADLNRSFAEAMASGKIEEGSDAWYEMKLNIEDTKAAIDDAEMSILKYANSIRQTEWDYFDYAQDRVSQLTSEAKFLQDLIDGEDMYDSNGNLSDAGTASIGLSAEKYGIYMAQADKYADEIKKINKQLASDPNNKDLIKRREDLLSSQQDSILAAKQEKEAMVELAKNGIQVELDAIKELVNAYTESLDSAKDLYDYQKRIAEKTSNISALEKQLAAYQNDMSEETRAKIQKIQLELQDAQDDLKNTEYDRFVSDAKDALDSMYSEYEDLLNTRFDDVDALFNQLIGVVNDNYVGISDYLSKEANNVGYAITEATNSLWANGGGANGLVSVYGTDISTKLASVGLTVENIFSVLEEIARANGVSFGSVKSYKSGGLIDYTGIANVHGSASNPEAVLDSADTKNFIMLRDAMRNANISNMLRSARDTSISKLGGADMRTLGKISGDNGYSVGEISITIPIEHVSDYNDFVNQLRADKQFEQLVQDVTIGRIAGRNSLGKNKFKW